MGRISPLPFPFPMDDPFLRAFLVITGFMRTQAVGVFAQFQLAEALVEESKHSSDSFSFVSAAMVAQQKGIHTHATCRLLRFMDQLGLVEEERSHPHDREGTSRFRLCAKGIPLLAHHPSGWRDRFLDIQDRLYPTCQDLGTVLSNAEDISNNTSWKDLRRMMDQWPSVQESETNMRVASLHAFFTAFVASQCVRTAAEWELADILEKDAEGRTLLDLVKELRPRYPAICEENVLCILRVLMGEGLITGPLHDRYSLSRAGQCLRTDIRASLHPVALFYGGCYYDVWGSLSHSIHTGHSAFVHRHGMPLFEFGEAQPTRTFSLLYQAQLRSIQEWETETILTAFPFATYETICDVGGGSGGFLSDILVANVSTRGILLDRPEVVETACNVIAQKGVASRCSAVGGDFFVAVPEGCQLYILKNILHDWDTEKGTQILRNVRSVQGRVLIVEAIRTSLSFFPVLLDMHTLVTWKAARILSEIEYRTVLSTAGFDVVRVVWLPHTPTCLLEACPKEPGDQ